MSKKKHFHISEEFSLYNQKLVWVAGSRLPSLHYSQKKLKLTKFGLLKAHKINI